MPHARPQPAGRRIGGVVWGRHSGNLGVILRHDSGEPVFGREVDDPSGQDVFPFGASVLMSRPQILLGGSAGLGLSLSLDTVLGDYLGLVGTLDPVEASRLPDDWVPLAIGIWRPREGWGILTAAPVAIPVTGIAPPVRLNTEPEPSTTASSGPPRCGPRQCARPPGAFGPSEDRAVA